MSIINIMQKSYKNDYFITKKYWLITFFDTIKKASKSMVTKKINGFVELYVLLPKTHFDGHCNTPIGHAIHYLLEKTYKF